MEKNKKSLFGILAIAVVGLTIGFIYCTFFKPVEVEYEYVQIKVPVGYPQLRVGVELAKTQYQAGEEIFVKPYLINMGEQPILVFGANPILFFKVYDADNRRVTLNYLADDMPVSVIPAFRKDILAQYILKPQIPHHHVEEGWRKVYTFTLDQPGEYKIVAWAEFSFDSGYAYPLHIYADPIWIEIK